VAPVEENGPPDAKKEDQNNSKYNHRLSYLFAFLAGLSFAVANYINSDLSIRLGFKWIYP